MTAPPVIPQALLPQIPAAKTAGVMSDVEDGVRDIVTDAGDAVRDAGDAAGDAVKDAGDAAGDLMNDDDSKTDSTDDSSR